MRYKLTYETDQGNEIVEFEHELFLTFWEIQQEVEKKLGFIPSNFITLERFQ
jgi:hypothetical protein